VRHSGETPHPANHPPMRVLALHGYGSSGAILAEQLRALSLAGDWVVSSPNAPIALPQGGFAWFLAKDPGPVYQGVEQSVDLLQAVVDKELQLYEQRRPVFDLIVGFSQGAVMALAFCARAKVPAHVRWRAALYLCAPPIRDVGLKSALEVKDPVNVLGFGTRDTIVSPVFMDDFVSLFPAGGRRLVLYHENHNPPHDAAATLEALRAPLTRRWFAFDFDGVLCDSARECGISAWLGCASLVQGADGTSFPPADILHRFCEVRPLLEHGFEALVLFFRLQTESVEDMLGAPDPAQRMDAARARMPGSPSVDELKARFKVARQKWIERDERGWLASNGFYGA
jgi:predicted esterase